MKVEWVKDRASLAEIAAGHVAALFEVKPDAAVALPTGETPEGMYAALVHREKARKISFREGFFFNLDEYAGLSVREEESYAAYIWHHFLGRIAVAPERVRLLRGEVCDPGAECRKYEAAIAEAGGLDLAVLGLGVNGHIGFNEPGTAWDSRSHPVELDAVTCRVHEEQTGGWVPPRRGLTMGIGTIRSARAVLLLIAGKNKEKAVESLFSGKRSLDCPATSLLDHPNLRILADETLQPPILAV